MNVELLVKPFDTASWKAGMVISAKSPGFYLEPARYERWVSGAGRPAELDDLMPSARADHEWFAARMQRVLKGATASEVAKARDISVENAEKWLAAQRKHHAILLEYGYDCNWGIKDIALFHVMLGDLSAVELSEVMAEPTNMDADPLSQRQVTGRRRVLLPLAKVLSSDSLLRAKDPAIRVIPPRGEKGLVPVTYAHFEQVL